MFLGIRGISLGAECEKLVGRATRNAGITSVYYASCIILALVAFFVEPGEVITYMNGLMYLYSIVCVLLNLILIYSCFGTLCPADEDENAIKRSRFAVINKMKNDKYTFVATGTDANGNETGTVSLDDGGDGTWDYVVLDNKVSPYVAYDATELYGIIAHDNTTTYVYDATAGTVTLKTDGREYVLDFLAPGTYKYSSQNVTVPTAAAFGLHLDLGYTEARVADYKHTDNGFARHYVWARDHVFMFDKQ